MTLEIRKFSEELREDWDLIVTRSKNGNFLHLYDYFTYHKSSFNDCSLVLYKKNRPSVVFPANRVDRKVYSHGGLTYAGLIYGDELRAAGVLEIFQRLVEHYRGLGCRSIIYKAIPHVYHRYPADEDLYALFRMGANLVRRDLSSVVSVENGIKMSKLRSRGIRKAMKEGVALREGDFFEAFHRLLATTLQRFGVDPVHSMQELQILHGRFPDRIRLFGAFIGDELVASVLLYDFGHIVHTQYLASSEEGKEIGALDYLLSHLLNEVCSEKQFFSFGISTENDGQYLNEGLLFQKEGFGGRAVVHDFYELEF